MLAMQAPPAVKPYTIRQDIEGGRRVWSLWNGREKVATVLTREDAESLARLPMLVEAAEVALPLLRASVDEAPRRYWGVISDAADDLEAALEMSGERARKDMDELWPE